MLIPLADRVGFLTGDNWRAREILARQCFDLESKNLIYPADGEFRIYTYSLNTRITSVQYQLRAANKQAISGAQTAPVAASLYLHKPKTASSAIICTLLMVGFE